MARQLGVARGQALDERSQLRRRGGGGAGGAQQGVNAVERLGATRDAGKFAHGALECDGQVACDGELVKVDVVVGVDERERLVGECLIDAELEEGLIGNDAAADELPRIEPQVIECFGGDEGHLGVRGVPALAHEFIPELGELACLRGAARLLAHDGRLIAQAQRQVTLAHARSDGVDHRGGVVRSYGEQCAVVVEEIERRIGAPGVGPADARRFDEGRFDGAVAMVHETGLHRRDDMLAHLRLVGQDVPKTARCRCHAFLPSHLFGIERAHTLA